MTKMTTAEFVTMLLDEEKRLPEYKGEWAIATPELLREHIASQLLRFLRKDVTLVGPLFRLYGKLLSSAEVGEYVDIEAIDGKVIPGVDFGVLVDGERGAILFGIDDVTMVDDNTIYYTPKRMIGDG